MKWIHNFIFALSICTISLVALYSVLGDTRKLTITPEHFNIYATKDASEGGVSEADITYDRQSVLSCELKQSSYAWPYCGISVYTDSATPTQGIDLSNYHTIRLKVRYEEAGIGANPSHDLRLYLRNYNSEYSKPDDEYTIKYNGMQFSPSGSIDIVEIPIKNLQVMTWWLADNGVAIEHSAPEFSNITRIDIATGSGAALGKHRIVIDKIEFEGAYLAQETLLYALLLSWMALGLAFSLHELRKNRVAYEKAQKRHRHLEKVNDTLRAQNYEFAELAHRDALTGTMNRYAVQHWLEQQSRQVRWGGITPSVFSIWTWISLKRTTNLGTKWGGHIARICHGGSDFYLLRRSTRSLGGGEEFVVFCPDTNIEQALEKAEMIRKNVEDHLWVHGESLTCSIGVAQMQNERVSETMARADEVLYQAKRNGRNRVEAHYGLLACEKKQA
ncbi:LOW QUALITY PROTEIN: GGDEF domain protein [Vibrio sp. JCM 18904]|nr:LOW QUALITY PROTEIN: GGDEF domain protein [Vibrio sp. JCM 18904]